MKPLLLLLAMLLTACGHIEYQPLATIDHVDHSRGYRLQHVFHDQQDDDLFLVLLFSGGGTRAAAFGYGVLEVLAATPITGHGKTASLLEKTDLVHGVSGGSILATYLGLHGKNTVPRFEREFLQQNLQSTVLRQLLSLANLPRLTSAIRSRRFACRRTRPPALPRRDLCRPRRAPPGAVCRHQCHRHEPRPARRVYARTLRRPLP